MPETGDPRFWKPEALETAIAAVLRTDRFADIDHLVAAVRERDTEWARTIATTVETGRWFIERTQRPTRGFTGAGGWEIDFDGVVHTYHLGWHDGTIYGGIVPGALVALWALQQDGPVHITTARPQLPEVAAWLHERGVPVVLDNQHPALLPTVDRVPASTAGMPAVEVLDSPPRFWDDPARVLVTGRKLPAKGYVDDLGIAFTGWDRNALMLRGVALDHRERVDAQAAQATAARVGDL